MSVYTKIIDSEVSDTFTRYTQSLIIPYIDYIAIGIQNKKTRKSTSIMSNIDWNNEFEDNQYAAFDPLRRSVLNTERSYICFDFIDHIDSQGAYIMHRRRKKCAKNGVILIERTPESNTLITLGSNYSKFNPIEFTIKYNKDLQVLKDDLSNILSSEIMVSLNL
ncbi:autoinducer binding domain-containing protein [Candidatus Odyssella thessalonicensis]|uniref:autoinducer binding domain-containing protein n=1 Tax=Candidatus Odyssella thessalonicensis TaxID=84647 RepID=UPI000225B97C|nr:autoinducer binding domain-containing protein [Candidatus Odyssella thessalonicensis]